MIDSNRVVSAKDRDESSNVCVPLAVIKPEELCVDVLFDAVAFGVIMHTPFNLEFSILNKLSIYSKESKYRLGFCVDNAGAKVSKVASARVSFLE